jgi:periplasmic mercuric ion binding protein
MRVPNHSIYLFNYQTIMKTIKYFLLSTLFIVLAQVGFAQEKTEKIKVSGECGMCKNKIEKAAKSGGATYALWDVAAKELTVKYSTTSSNTAKIQQSVAAAGYDTEKVKATNEAYEKLHACCKYERTAASAATESCCNADGTCKNADQGCCKDGKCTKATAAGKEATCTQEAQAEHAAKGDGKAACCKKG